jgi:zinc transport system permease protein
MIDLFQYEFFINAFIASILASVACGIIGTYVVVKRIVFISGGISHTAYGGIGLGYLLGINPLIGALTFSLGAAGLISILRKHHFQHEDTLIGIMWSFGMALGILFIGATPGYVPDLMSYLFGNILTVSFDELILLLGLNIVILILNLAYFQVFQAVTFDEEYSKSIGVKVERFYLLLLVMIAITVVMLIKLVGIILIVALLTIPPVIARKYSRSLLQMMLLSIVFGIVFTLFGLFSSYYLNLPTGSTIIIVSILGYAGSFMIKTKRTLI